MTLALINSDIFCDFVSGHHHELRVFAFKLNDLMMSPFAELEIQTVYYATNRSYIIVT